MDLLLNIQATFGDGPPWWVIAAPILMAAGTVGIGVGLGLGAVTWAATTKFAAGVLTTVAAMSVVEQTRPHSQPGRGWKPYAEEGLKEGFSGITNAMWDEDLPGTWKDVGQRAWNNLKGAPGTVDDHLAREAWRMDQILKGKKGLFGNQNNPVLRPLIKAVAQTALHLWTLYDGITETAQRYDQYQDFKKTHGQ